ncbi:MAG: ABC transporter permease, partial [Chloroflexota bacterium]
MKIGLFLYVALQNMMQHKMRTSLTLLGLIVGITSVLLMTGIGRGFQKVTEEGMSSLLPTKLNIREGFNQDGSPVTPLTMRDVTLLHGLIGRSAIQAAAPIKELYDIHIRGLAERGYIQVVATNVDYALTENLELIQGRFFTEDEENQKALVL